MSPRALPGTRLSACPSHRPRRWTLAGSETAGPSLSSLGLSLRTVAAAAARGWLRESPRVPTLSQECSCHTVEVSPVGACGLVGCRARGCRERQARAMRLLGAWPSSPAHSCWRHPPGWLCLPVAMVPVGGCVTSKPGNRQTVARGLKGPGGQPLWAASPTPEGELHEVLSSPGTASHSLPGELARPSLSSRDFH